MKNIKKALLFHLSLDQHLSDMYFGVRNKCLQLLGCLGMVDSLLSKDGEDLVLSLGLCAHSAQRNIVCMIEFKCILYLEPFKCSDNIKVNKKL